MMMAPLAESTGPIRVVRSRAFLTLITDPADLLDRQRPGLRGHQPTRCSSSPAAASPRPTGCSSLLAALFVVRFVYMAVRGG